MRGIECPRSDCIVPISVPTTLSMVAWQCLRRCHVTPGSPNFFAAGFKRLRKRFHRSDGNASRGAKTRALASAARVGSSARSEEHTSELQSHLNLVCRLLLEKKKKKTKQPSDSSRHGLEAIDQTY